MLEAKTISVSIRCDWRELYEAFWRPESFPRWASGLGNGSLERVGSVWKAYGSDGDIEIRFSDYNKFGVMDHWLDLGPGRIIHVPLRIVANEGGAEVMLTLFRQPDMAVETFARDAAWVTRDLSTLKRLAEAE